MHEMSIAESILDIVKETLADKCPDGILKEVVVQVGELVAVVPDSLTFCYEAIVKDTEFENSKMIVEIVPLMATCNACTHHFKIEKYQFSCPACGATAIEVGQGQELQISHLEVE